MKAIKNQTLQPICSYREGIESEKTLVEYRIFKLGADVLITITGGQAHIGALGFLDKESIDEADTFQFKHHREEIIVKEAIEGLKGVFEGQLLIVAGIHYDDINKKQISIIVENNRKIINSIKNDVNH